MNTLLVLSIFICSAAAAAATNQLPWKRGGMENELNMNINMCLMACGMCFDTDGADAMQEAVMMECANDLCLQEMSAGKPLKAVWRKECPQLSKVWRKF